MKNLAESAQNGIVDAGLLQKYNRPVPRYTSYPTALEFRSIDDRLSAGAFLADSENATGPLSLYLHLPFCKSLCWFCGCTKIISTDQAIADRYLDYLELEIDMIQPTEMNREAIGWLRDAGIDSLNVDLIYGLPGQSVESFRRTLDEVLDYKPDRFAIFSYAHIPWSKFAQKILEQSSIPEASVKIKLLELIVETLTERGYTHIGMDHFTLENDSLAVAQRAGALQRNFQGYSLYADTEICSFGISSISQTDRTYRQNVKELDVYYKRLDAGELPIERGYMLNSEDQIRREVIMRLMCDMKLDYRSLSEALDIDFKEYFRSDLAKLDSLERDGLVDMREDELVVAGLGRLLIRNIAIAFDVHSVEKEQAFSKSV